MKKIIALLLTITTLTSTAQYKNDNVAYKTVFPEDLCQTLKENPGYLLLDVRSPGEHSDTSRFAALNIGKMKGALNIDNSEVAKRLREIMDYKNKPVFVYCSHSQRSRRVSKTLADSGFTKVYNVNGGMTTLHLLNGGKFFCGDYSDANGFKLLTPQQFCEAAAKGKTNFIDIRKDSSYNGISLDAKANARGKFKMAKHISIDDLERTLDMSRVNDPVVLIDESGDQSAKAAAMLVKKGFKDVGILFNGLDQWNNTNRNDLACKDKYWQPTVAFNMITTDDFDKLAKENKKLHIIDVRSAEEFSNTHKDYWRNGGKIRNASNMPVADLNNHLAELEVYKNDPILVYAFSSSPEVYAAANTLVKNGFKNVNVLVGGLFNIRWRAANIKGKSGLKDWVVDVPVENL